MYDSFERHINYLRVSVTDRCNLRCSYCMPEEGIPMLSHSQVLSYEEMAEVVRIAVKMGVSKVRITGGEPLVRKGIADFVRMLSDISGIHDLSMTTNGILLPRYARELAEAGLQRVNISLDTMDPKRYSKLTRLGKLEDVLKGIDAALGAGLTPVKLNCVVAKNRHEPDALAVADYASSLGLQVRFIRRMSLSEGEFSIVDGGSGGNCSICNRLRLTADGHIQPCLFGDSAYSVRELGAEAAIIAALKNKPACGSINTRGEFYTIGG